MKMWSKKDVDRMFQEILEVEGPKESGLRAVKLKEGLFLRPAVLF